MLTNKHYIYKYLQKYNLQAAFVLLNHHFTSDWSTGYRAMHWIKVNTLQGVHSAMLDVLYICGNIYIQYIYIDVLYILMYYLFIRK